MVQVTVSESTRSPVESMGFTPFVMDFDDKDKADTEMYAFAARKFLELQSSEIESFSYVEMFPFGNGVKVVARKEYAGDWFFQRSFLIELTEEGE